MSSTNVDGGWGWVVVLGAFAAQTLSDGIPYGFGILYVDLMDTFQGTSAEISSIVSICYGSIYIIGPFAGALTNKFGFRFVTVLGAFMEATGLFLSAYTLNLQFLYFTVGILIGVGNGLMYVGCFVCVSEYFDQKRPMATSISSCGSGVGTFLFGFLYSVCIDQYSWRGALVVFSGIMLNGVACGVIFRPFTRDLTKSEIASISQNFEKYTTPRASFSFSSSQKDPSQEASKSPTIQLVGQYHASDDESKKSHLKLPSVTVDSNKISYTKGESTNSDAYEEELQFEFESKKEANKTARLEYKTERQTSAEFDQNMDQLHSYGQKYTDRFKSIVSVILGTTDLSLLKEVHFIIYGLSTFLYSFGYGIPYILLPDMAKMNGFSSSEAAWVISEFGIASILGKFFFGTLSQVFSRRFRHTNTLLNSISVILSGVAIACAPRAFYYWVLLVIGGTFGFMSATVNALVTLVLIEQFGKERLATAFGWTNLFGGIGFIIGPVVAGWLYDVTGTYEASFLAAGISLVLAGLILVPMFIAKTSQTSYSL